MKSTKPFAEIIESSLTGWLAQSWQWDDFPSFGSLVCVENKNRILFGIVHQIQTGSMDPVRYPFAYKKTEEELLKEQPQIFEFLKTTFSCLIIGYREKSRIHYQLAPEPPKIHSFISGISSELCKEFFAHDNYLHLLFGLSNQLFNLDELLLALVKNLANNKLLTEKKLEQIIDSYSLLTGNDYRRLKLFLQRVEPITN
jgi:HAS barrel domain